MLVVSASTLIAVSTFLAVPSAPLGRAPPVDGAPVSAHLPCGGQGPFETEEDDGNS